MSNFTIRICETAALFGILHAGCAHSFDFMTLAPDTIGPEFEHMSHASQHFGSDQSNYGSEIASIVAHWNMPRGFYLELAEGADLDPRWTAPHHSGCGELQGPREEFSGRIGYRFRIK
jgi:hypothetical protein